MANLIEAFKNKTELKAYYSQPSVVQHYADAVITVGLWLSEAKICNRIFSKEATLLDIGTGAGRVPIGLHEQGYSNIMGIDCCKPMVEAARDLSKRLDCAMPFQTADATALPFGRDVFDGIICNDVLMEIPSWEERETAIFEIAQALKPEGLFLWTIPLDKNLPKDLSYRSAQDSKDSDNQYLLKALKAAKLEVEVDVARSLLASEPPEVEAFAGECQFWIAKKLA